MRLGIGRQLEKLKIKLVPGYSVSFRDIILFKKTLLGVVAPLNLYGRWRQLLDYLVPEQRFCEAGLENMKEVYPGKFDRQIMVMQCLINCLKVPIKGVVAEFGCFRGHTAIQIAQTMRNLGDRSEFYLFDSFQGFPESDLREDAFWKKGDLASNYDEVKRRFEPFENVKLIKGFFKETLSEYDHLRFKFAHVDADLYSSIKDVNGMLLDRIVPGGIIVYDDYGFSNCVGAKNAIDESMNDRDDFTTLYVPTGQFLSIKR